MPDTDSDDLTLRQRKARLRRKVQRLFDGRALVLASNRGPISFDRTTTGRVRRRRGTGGVVSAISAVSRYANPTWICSPMSHVDRQVAMENHEEPIALSTKDYDFRLRFVLTPEQTYDDYYSVVSNPLLWFVQHYMWDAPRSPTFTRRMWSAWESYRQVNLEFAHAIAEEVERASKPAIVMLQDYHLYLCPGQLREHLPHPCLLSHFVHIPWPGPDYWMILPPRVREEIFSSLCTVDVLGFHNRRYATNFLRTCQSLLMGAKVDYSAGTVRWQGRTVMVRSYPISMDLTALRRLSRSKRTLRQREHLLPRLGEQTIVRVDRIEPSKNIVRGFQAFDLLLEEHPEHLGEVRLIASLVPSRLQVEEYQRYLEEIIVLAQRINLKHGDREWQPVKLYVGEHHSRAIASMRLYDVLLVNPIMDGMNLVAKEGPVVNERDGVLVLSEGAGAVEELGESALVVSPYDIVDMADSLHAALIMPAEERHEKANRLREIVEGHTVTDWLYNQLVDLSSLLESSN